LVPDSNSRDFRKQARLGDALVTISAFGLIKRCGAGLLMARMILLSHVLSNVVAIDKVD
jgi:hypothetical protein